MSSNLRIPVACILLSLMALDGCSCQRQAKPAPLVEAVVPNQIEDRVRVPASVQGKNFFGAVLGRLSDKEPPRIDRGFRVLVGPVELAPEDITFVDTQTLNVLLPALPPGTYDVTVTAPDGRSGTLPGGLTVVAGPPGSVTSVSVEDRADGLGNVVGGSVTLGTPPRMAYAVGRDAIGRFAGLQSVTWTLTSFGPGTLAPLATPATSATFTALRLGRTRIRATPVDTRLAPAESNDLDVVGTQPVTGRLVWELPGAAVAGYPFSVTLRAVDDAGTPAPFTGNAQLESEGALSCVGPCLDPSTTTAFSSGVWAGTVKVGMSGTWELSANGGAFAGKSPPLQVEPAPQASNPTVILEATPRVVEVNQTVVLDASKSFDYQDPSSALRFEWSIGPAAPGPTWPSGGLFTSPSIQRFRYGTAGVALIEVAVMDTDGGISIGAVSISVVPAGESCAVDAPDLTDDGASSCTSRGPDGKLSLAEAVRLANAPGATSGARKIFFAAPMTITNPQNRALQLDQPISVFGMPGLVLENIPFVVNALGVAFQSLELTGAGAQVTINPGASLTVREGFLHDAPGITVHGQLSMADARLARCTAPCVRMGATSAIANIIDSTFLDVPSAAAIQGDTCSTTSTAPAPLVVVSSTFARALVGVRLTSGCGYTEIVNNTFDRNTVGVEYLGGTRHLLRNNIFTRNSGASVTCPAGTFPGARPDSQVLFGNFSDPCVTPADPGTHVADPLYLLPGLDDYRLDIRSGEIDNGADAGRDLNGASPGLFYGRGYDRGGHETW